MVLLECLLVSWVELLALPYVWYIFHVFHVVCYICIHTLPVDFVVGEVLHFSIPLWPS